MSKTSQPAAVSAALVLLLAPPAPAQSPGPAPPVRASVSVTAVDLDVSITRGGEPVDDAKKEDILLKIDGKVVPLDYLTRVETGRLTGPARGPAKVSGDADRNVARTFLLVLDEDHLMPRDRPRVVEASRKLLQTLGPSDRLAVAVLDRQAFRMVSPPETDRSAALAALEKFGRERKFGMMAVSFFPASTVRGREAGAFRELERAVRALGALPGRKEVILISRGLDRSEGDPGVSLVEEFDRVVREADLSRVTIHTIAAGGLEAGGGPAAGGAPYC